MPNHSVVPDNIAPRYEVLEWRDGIAIPSAAREMGRYSRYYVAPSRSPPVNVLKAWTGKGLIAQAGFTLHVSGLGLEATE